MDEVHRSRLDGVLDMRPFLDVIRLMRLENDRLMRLGYPHMNEAEMRWILGGIGYEKQFDELVKEIKCSTKDQQ